MDRLFPCDFSHADFAHVSEWVSGYRGSPQTAPLKLIEKVYHVFKTKGQTFPPPSQPLSDENKSRPVFPLPYSKVPKSGHSSTLGRVTVAKVQLTNMVLLLFNTVNQKFSSKNLTETQKRTYYCQHLPTSAQRRLISNVESRVEVFLNDLVAQMVDGHLPCELVRRICKAEGLSHQGYLQSAQPTAQWITKIEDIDLPKLDPSCPPIPKAVWKESLPPLLRDFVDRPESYITERNEIVNNTTNMCEPAVARDLIDRLCDEGLITWMDKSKVYDRVSGVFGVSKASGHKVRLIVNLSEVNKLWSGGELHAEARRNDPLPTTEDFRYLVFDNTESQQEFSVIINKQDVSTCFYNLESGSELGKYFQLDCQNPKRCRTYPEGLKNLNLVPTFNRIPMGYLYSVFIVQSFIKDTCSALPPEMNLATNRISRPPVYSSIIDDVFAAASNDDRPILVRWYDLVKRRWKKVDLPSQELKNSPQLEDQELLGWLLSRRGHFGLAPKKLYSIMVFSCYLMGRFKTSGSMRAKLLGKCVNASLSRRQLLSLFSSSSFDCYQQTDQLLPWSSSALSEMLAWFLLVPWSYMDLTRKYSPWVMISDACRTQVDLNGSGYKYHHGIGAGYGWHPPTQVESLVLSHHIGSRKHPKRITVFPEHILENEEEEHSKLLVSIDFGRYEPYWYSTTCLAYPDNAPVAVAELRGSRINLESRLSWASSIDEGVATTARQAKGRPQRGGRVAVCTDNSAALFSASRGRSSCVLLNREIRKILCFSILNSEDYFFLYINTHLNWWSDRLSRSKIYRAPKSNSRRGGDHNRFHGVRVGEASRPGPPDSDSSDSDPGIVSDDHASDWEYLDKRLRTLGLDPRTAARYNSAVEAFESWLSEEDRRWPNCTENLDLLVAIYQLDRHDRGLAPSANLICGLRSRNPNLRLDYSKRVLSKSKIEWIERPALPFLLSHVHAMIAKFAAERDWAYLCGICLMWMGYLRCSEMLSLSRSDLSFIENPNGSHDLIISLRSSKVSKRRHDSILVSASRHGSMILLLQDALSKLELEKLRGRTPTERLRDRISHRPIIDHNYNKFRTNLNKKLDYFGLSLNDLKKDSKLRPTLQGLQFSSHSFRRGQATFAAMHDKLEISKILLEGRWKSVDSFRRYLTQSLAILVAVDVGNDKLVEYSNLGSATLKKYLDKLNSK